MVIGEVMRVIEIDLTEDDCDLLKREVVHNEGTIEWVFRTIDDEGEDFIIRFIPFQDGE